MKNNLGLNKKKIGAIVVCGALFIATAATAAFASAPVGKQLSGDGTTKVVSSQKSEMSTLIAKGDTICAVFDENGNVTTVPFQREDGNGTIANDATETPSDVPFLTQPAGSIVGMVKMEDGVMLYSIDGGKTWSENEPVDSDIANDTTETPSDVPFQTTTKSVMVKMEDGVMLFSIDNGKTWSENEPLDSDITE